MRRDRTGDRDKLGSPFVPGWTIHRWTIRDGETTDVRAVDSGYDYGRMKFVVQLYTAFSNILVEKSRDHNLILFAILVLGIFLE